MYDISSTIQSLGVSDGTMMGIDMRSGLSPDYIDWLKTRIGKPSLATEMGLTSAGQIASAAGLRGAINAHGIGERPRPARQQGKHHSRRHTEYEAWAKGMQKDGLYTLPDAAAAIGRSAPTVIAWVRHGKLPASMVYSPVIGRAVSMVRLEDVMACAERRRMVGY